MIRNPNHSLRVLHIASWFPSQVHQTLGNFVERHVQAISTRHGGEIWFAAAVPDGQTIPKDTVLKRGSCVERIVYFRARKPMVWHVTRALLEAAQSYANENSPPFDLIHLHVAYPAGRAARQLAKRWQIPLVVTEHWTAYQEDQRQALPFWRRQSMLQTGHAATVLCPVSEDLAQSMRSFGINGSYRPVPNVVDTELFHPAPEVRSDESSFLALHISSLRDDQKNISGLLRSLQIALANCPNLHVSIIGDGDPTPHQSYARELGIANRIEILGEISLPEVAQRMRESDALILFSRFENFPCVIPEAWASGIPVLSTDVGGISEHLTSERGTLIASEDESALAQRLTDWSQGRIHFDPTALRAHAEKTFSIEAVAGAYHDVYVEALSTFEAP